MESEQFNMGEVSGNLPNTAESLKTSNMNSLTHDETQLITQSNSHDISTIEPENVDMLPTLLSQSQESESKSSSFMEDFATKLDITESSEMIEGEEDKVTKDPSDVTHSSEDYRFQTVTAESGFTNENSLSISNEAELPDRPVESSLTHASLCETTDDAYDTVPSTDSSNIAQPKDSESVDSSVDASSIEVPAESTSTTDTTDLPIPSPDTAMSPDANLSNPDDTSVPDTSTAGDGTDILDAMESDDALNESRSDKVKMLNDADADNETLASTDDVSMLDTDAGKDKDTSEEMEVENAAIFEHVNAENDDKEEEKDEEVAVTTSSKGQDEDPIDCWPLNAEPKDILSICPEDNDECIIPDDEKEADSVKTFPQTETKDSNEEEASDIAIKTTDETSESSATPKEPDQSYDLTMDDAPSENRCIVCLLTKNSRYHFSYQNEEKYICDELCLTRFKENPTLGLDKPSISDGSDSVTPTPEGNGLDGGTSTAAATSTSGSKVSADSTLGRPKDKLAKARACADCKNPVLNDINSYSWEAMDFCSEACLARFQKQIGGFCQQCNIPVRNNVLGKYCVRFGSALRQFCSGSCLEMHKRDLRLCTYCQEDLGDSNAVECEAGKKFCTSNCMHNFASMTTNRLPVVPKDSVCCVCINRKTIEIIFERDGVPFMFCGNPCLVAYKFVNKVSPAKCGFCYKYVERHTLDDYTMFYEGKLRSFCSSICKNIYIIAHRKIVPCSWCKVKKYNFDMIRKTSARNQIFNICSLNCLKYFNTSLSVVSSRSRQVCDYCLKSCKPVYHLTMSDGTTRNFCTHQCVTDFQKKFERRHNEPPPISLNNSNNRISTNAAAATGTATPPPQKEAPFNKQPIHTYQGKKGARGRPSRKQVLPDRPGPLPVITSVCSLAPSAQGGSPSGSQTETSSNDDAMSGLGLSMPTPSEPVPQKTKRLLVVQRPPIIEQRNVMTTATPMNCEKDTNFTPDQQEKHCQTDIPDEAIQVIPIPIPIYVPSPMFAYHTPLPTPIPFPLPIPIPILIPITKHTAENIMKEIKQKVQVKGPTDPFEAELLMMAELVAAEKKDAELSDDDGDGPDGADDGYSPEPGDASGFGDDMLQMALKMASDFDQQAVDLEGALTASTITPQQQAQQAHHHMVEGEDGVVLDETGQPHMTVERGRGRRRGGAGTRQRSYGARRGRRGGASAQHQQHMEIAAQMAPPEPPPPPEPVEKPDAHMCLKYTFGVNAWKQWVTTKNVELERSSRRLKPFKTELLQLTSDELNYSLCLFVKEVRKPNGSEYAPDTIYYLCLGIQQYLFENGRIDNIFCDSYYDKFTEVLDEVCKKFSALYNDSHYIVTRVEEEHLWESKQLGAHSPHVLLSTLMFFNTKHFNLTSVDEHMQLSFSHIMKHWKRNPNQPANATSAKTPGSRNVLLRFYPPQSALESNSRKKKVYEQQENEENPLRCPVKLYEFYLSKCPESVKTRNDVFYLMPERSCVPDSPVWYSTIAQERPALEKMLHRVKMVKEINVALLTT